MHARWIADGESPRRHVVSYQRTGADHRTLANVHAAHDDRAAADRGVAMHHRAFKAPVAFALRRTIGIGRARPAIVDKNHAVADEDFILDRDPGTNEAVARDFAAGADQRVALDFDERADTGVRADFTAVEINERADADIRSQPHVAGHTGVAGYFLLIHRYSSLFTQRPWRPRPRGRRATKGWPPPAR